MPCIARHCLLKAKRSQLINTAAAERCQAKQQLIKPYINHCIINNCIQFIDNKPIVKNLCVNLLVSKKDLVVRSDSQRSEPYRQYILHSAAFNAPFVRLILFHWLVFSSFMSRTSGWPYNRPSLGSILINDKKFFNSNILL